MISGDADAVKRAVELASAGGAKRAVMLAVSAPFHSSLMLPAQLHLEKELRKTTFHNLHVPLVTNVDADIVSNGEEARESLIRQVSLPVRWEESIRLLIEQGVNTFVEVGPGRVLTGLLRQIDRSIHAFNVEDEKSLNTTLDKLAARKANLSKHDGTHLKSVCVKLLVSSQVEKSERGRGLACCFYFSQSSTGIHGSIQTMFSLKDRVARYGCVPGDWPCHRVGASGVRRARGCRGAQYGKTCSRGCGNHRSWRRSAGRWHGCCRSRTGESRL